MRRIDDQLIQEITQTIVERFHPRRIVLFGSHARGDAGPESDLDLMVEMESKEPPFSRAVAVSQAFPWRDWPLDVFVFTPDEIQQNRDLIGDLIYTIEHEGKTLYARS